MTRQKTTLFYWQQMIVAAIFAACVLLSTTQGYAAENTPSPQSKEDKERIVKALLEGDKNGGFNREPQLPPAFYPEEDNAASRSSTPSAPVHVSAPVASGEKRGLFEVTLKDAEKAIGQALVEQGAAEYVEAILLKPRSSVLYRSSTPITIQVATLTFENQKHSWSANLLMTYEGQVVTAMPSSGRWQEMQQIPTLNRSMRIGEVIQEADITDDVYPMYRLPANSITAKADLIGKTPKRIISPSRPIRINEVQAPIILAKDTTVTMRFHSTGMEISAVGITMEAGAKDQMIRVKNADSNTIVQAKVISASEVQIVDTLASSTSQPMPIATPRTAPMPIAPPSPEAVMLAPEEVPVIDTAATVQQQTPAPHMPQQTQPQAQPQLTPQAAPQATMQPAAQPTEQLPLQPSQTQLQPWQTQHQEHNQTQQQSHTQPLQQPQAQQPPLQTQPPLPWQQQTQQPAPQAQTAPPPAKTYGNPPKLKMAQPARSALQIGSPELQPTDPQSEAASVLKELPSFSSSQPADSAASE